MSKQPNVSSTTFPRCFREGRQFTDRELREAFAQIAEDRAFSLRDYYTKSRFNPAGKKQVAPKSATQRKYIQTIQDCDVVFGNWRRRNGQDLPGSRDGLAGADAKTSQPQFALARPAVEAGEETAVISARRLAGQSRSISGSPL